MKKKLFSVLLAAIMIVGLLPAMSFAKPIEIVEVDECVYTQKADGFIDGEVYQLYLGGKEAGWFKFTAVDGGWKISQSTMPGHFGVILNSYLAVEDGKLTHTDVQNATVWTYRNGAFSVTETTKQQIGGYWIGLIYVPNYGTRTVTETYYLSTTSDGQRLSMFYTGAEFYEQINSEQHDWNPVWTDCKDGKTHTSQCANCGEWRTEEHSFGDDGYCTARGCHAMDPAKIGVTIRVDVKETKTKEYIGWWPWGYFEDVSVYTADVLTETFGVRVAKVMYRVNDGRWMIGTHACSDEPIETMEVVAWDSNGKAHEYNWSATLETVGDVLYTYQGILPTNSESAASLDEGGASLYFDETESCLRIGGMTVHTSAEVTPTEYGYSFMVSGFTIKFMMTNGHLTNILVESPIV